MMSRVGATATGVQAPALTVVGGFAGAHLLTFGPTPRPTQRRWLWARATSTPISLQGAPSRSIASGARSHASRQYSAPQAGDMPAVPVASTQAP